MIIKPPFLSMLRRLTGINLEIVRYNFLEQIFAAHCLHRISDGVARTRVQKEFGSFDTYLWGFVDGKPIQNRFRSGRDVPATTPISDALSKDLKKRGFTFVGSTIMYAFMQATGMVNDHITGCFRHKECAKLA